MSTAHTSGPWKFIDESAMSPDEPYWIGVNDSECGFVSHAVVRAGGKEASDLGDMEANARLIAAAPELLDALRLLLPMVDEWAGNTEIPVVDAARAAIAKATTRAADTGEAS